MPITVICTEFTGEMLRGWVDRGLAPVQELTKIHDVEYVDLPTGTANTREDGRALLAHAASHRLEVATTTYPLDRAADALADLAGDRVTGAAVLVP